MDDEFLKQLSGSGAANFATAVLFFLIYIVRNKCRHSRCKGNSICCQFEFKDDETRDEEEDIERGTVRKKIKIQVQKLQRSVDPSLRGSD